MHKIRLRGNTWQYVAPKPVPGIVVALAALQQVGALRTKAETTLPQIRRHRQDAVQFLELWALVEKSVEDAAQEGISRQEFLDAMRQMQDQKFMAFVELQKHYAIEQVRA